MSYINNKVIKEEVYCQQIRKNMYYNSIIYLYNKVQTYLVRLQQFSIHCLVYDLWRSNHKFISFSPPTKFTLFLRQPELTELLIVTNLCSYIFSINIVRCSVPLPLTRNVSAVSPSSTFIAKFLSSSRYNLSRRFRLVTYLKACRRPLKIKQGTIKDYSQVTCHVSSLVCLVSLLPGSLPPSCHRAIMPRLHHAPHSWLLIYPTLSQSLNLYQRASNLD